MAFWSMIGKKKGNDADSGSRKNEYEEKEKRIKCPYCFKEFQHDEVHFKAMTLKEVKFWGSAEDDFGVEEEDYDPFGDTENEEEDKNLSDSAIAKLFEEKEDLLFKNFWSRYPNELSWQYANYPVITKNDTQMIIGTYHCDEDGIVDSVTDFYGMETKERICPYCHNPLPSNYGKYQVHFIATVGITSSGKTVYLSQLLRRMDEYMANVDLVTFGMTSANERFLEEHPVEMDVPLPQGTAPGVLNAPLFYVILSKNEYHTLVFYDVAGENCVDANEMDKYAAFIQNADGIIMILDPGQFQIVNQSDEKVTRPKAVVEAMFNSFLGHISGGQSQVPLALALSKSDMLEKQNLVSPNSNIFREIVYDEFRPGFDLQQYRNLMGEVRKFLREMPEGRATMKAMEHCFSRTGLFAFSSLNCEVKKEKQTIDGEDKEVAIPVARPNPLRIEEPLLWLLAEFGIIQKLEPARR